MWTPEAKPVLAWRHNTKPAYPKDEWLTPRYVVDMAREVMGGIDLDPASSHYANETNVKASSWYGREVKGLEMPWFGRVWLNPPFSATADWVDAFVMRAQHGQFDQGVLLVNANTYAKWFHRLAALYPVCLTRGRIRFERNPTLGVFEGGNNPVTGQAIFYAGPDVESFAAIFGELGAVFQPVGKSVQIGGAAGFASSVQHG